MSNEVEKKAWYRQGAFYAVVTLVIIAGLIFGGLYYVWSRTLGRMQVVKLQDSQQSTQVTLPPPAPTQSLTAQEHKVISGVVNILLLGVDTRQESSMNERSDSMMILSINKDQKRLKLISLQRDMLVEIPGRARMDKLTHAHSYGGAASSIATVNHTFRTNLQYFVEINMYNMENLVNALGGVEVDVLPAEVPTINRCIAEANRVFPNTTPSPYLDHAGRQLLNGRQAVGFARDRDNNRDEFIGDYARMYRQRILLQHLYERFKDAGLSQKLNFISEAFSMVRTNMPRSEVLEMAKDVLPLMNQSIEQLSVPIEPFYRSYSGTAWVNLCDFNGMIPEIQKFIYGRTFPFERVYEVPGAPNSSIPMAPSLIPQTPPPVQPAESSTPLMTDEHGNPLESTVEPSDTTEPSETEETSPDYSAPEPSTTFDPGNFPSDDDFFPTETTPEPSKGSPPPFWRH